MQESVWVKLGLSGIKAFSWQVGLLCAFSGYFNSIINWICSKQRSHSEHLSNQEYVMVHLFFQTTYSMCIRKYNKANFFAFTAAMEEADVPYQDGRSPGSSPAAPPAAGCWTLRWSPTGPAGWPLPVRPSWPWVQTPHSDAWTFLRSNQTTDNRMTRKHMVTFRRNFTDQTNQQISDSVKYNLCFRGLTWDKKHACLEQISDAMMHMWGVRKSFRRMMRMARMANATSCRLWYTSCRTKRGVKWSVVHLFKNISTRRFLFYMGALQTVCSTFSLHWWTYWGQSGVQRLVQGHFSERRIEAQFCCDHFWLGDYRYRTGCVSTCLKALNKDRGSTYSCNLKTGREQEKLYRLRYTWCQPVMTSSWKIGMIRNKVRTVHQCEM